MARDAAQAAREWAKLSADRLVERLQARLQVQKETIERLQRQLVSVGGGPAESRSVAVGRMDRRRRNVATHSHNRESHEIIAASASTLNRWQREGRRRSHLRPLVPKVAEVLRHGPPGPPADLPPGRCA